MGKREKTKKKTTRSFVKRKCRKTTTLKIGGGGDSRYNLKPSEKDFRRADNILARHLNEAPSANSNKFYGPNSSSSNSSSSISGLCGVWRAAGGMIFITLSAAFVFSAMPL